MSRFTVIFDANVLYPAPSRDLLVQLATTGLFRAHWTKEIHDEWIRNLKAKRPELSDAALTRTRELMDRVVDDARVTGYEPLIEGLHLPDPDDRHVLAAALRAGADAIVTFNLKDFPEAALAPYDVEALHPDAFVSYQCDLAQATVCEAVRLIRGRLHNPPYDVDAYLTHLAASGYPATAETLRGWRNFL
ncbi:hypothetical protein PC39_10202 [Salinisphaera sp. PC39]|uniref:PIN domain-containing protein n=1 Tax=Salinisphaera sp. PC39 TaxID=1304156 RepID=UPI00333F7E3B